MIVRLVIWMILSFGWLQASYIALSDDQNVTELYKKVVENDSVLHEIAKKEDLKLKKVSLNGKKFFKIEEFKDENDLALFYMHIVSTFPNALILHTPKDISITKIVPVSSTTEVSEENGDDITIWIALFGLALIALFALYLSSEEIKVIKKEHQKMQEKQEEIIEIQNKILTSMSENIHTIAQEAVKETKDLVLTSAQNQKLENTLKKVVKSENRLLDITTDLLEFLRIKSNKIAIVNESFQLINLLNDITGQVSVTDKYIDFDLMYDIDKSVPDILLGDMLHLSKIAANIIDYFKQNGAKSVVVAIKREGKFANARLIMLFKSDLTYDIENDPNIFISRYDEEHKRYEGLNLYVAKELSIKMGGDLYAKNDQNKRAEFHFLVPFKKPTLPELVSLSKPLPKEFEEAKIVLIDKNQECLDIDRKIFEKLNLHIDGVIRREFNHNSFDFSKYHIAIIDEAILTSTLLEKLASYENLKVVSLSSIFVDSKFEDLLDETLKRPLTTSQVKENFISLFDKNVKRKREEIKKSDLLIYRGEFADAPNVTLDSFKDFEGASLLIVEDNFINQKVLLSVLKYSKMDIDIANNGKEAVDLVHAKRYNLVLMDINMPVMDGYTATLKIREAGFDKLPIVALSALTSKDEINKMFDVGMNGYLAKPFYKEKLYTVFTMFIKNRATESKDNENAKEQKSDTLNFQTLDIKTGLQNSKNELFYKEILQEFKDAFGNSGELFEKLVNEYRFEQAKMLMVDIRGLSGAIGANRLQELSIEILQFILYNKHEMLNEYAQKLKEEMVLLNGDIELYLDT